MTLNCQAACISNIQVQITNFSLFSSFSKEALRTGARFVPKLSQIGIGTTTIRRRVALVQVSQLIQSLTNMLEIDITASTKTVYQRELKSMWTYILSTPIGRR